MIHAKGKTGQVHFDGQYVTITRNGLLARSVVGKGEKRLHVSQISAVRWKPAGLAVNGYVQFSLPGGNEIRSGFGSQTQKAVKDENSVVFTRSQQAGFEALRAAIEHAVAAHHAPRHPAPAAVASVADELAKLGMLVRQGVITQRDFDTAKARLLGL
ncbi:DUF4429 domain-containing protein [Kitasatospora sp. NPDC059722]|uniref:DUF4429 domain-containing protein n=1 Tax=Kitasatospora sp. NPDC059722 TaxID=3346925 RepID=UPI0036C02B1B